MPTTRSVHAVLTALVSVWIVACHREVELPRLSEATISFTGDRFFDVKAFSSDRVLVIGYGGRVLETTDAGRTWRSIPTPTDRALYRIRFADDQHGWIAGQDGVILFSADGGRT